MRAPDVLQGEALRRLSRAERLLMVASGKGGVGKSLISMSLASTLSEMGRKVGLLDLDVHGPSIPQVFRSERLIRATKHGLEPLKIDGLELMSLGYIVRGSPVPLGGEDKMSLLKMMVALTNWSNLDYLVVDLPPGTGDEMLLAIRALKRHPRSGAVLVTLPSMLSLSVVRRALDLLRGEGVSVLGIVENMAYIRCGGEAVRPFGSLDYASLGVNVLGSLPLDPAVEEAIASGKPPHKASREVMEAISAVASRIEVMM